MVSIPGSSIGNLYEVVRKALGRLGVLETKTTGHAQEIGEIKEELIRTRGELERVSKVVDHQGRASEEQRQKVETLTNKVGDLERSARGRSISAGIHKKRAERAEAALEKLKKTRQKRRPRPDA